MNFLSRFILVNALFWSSFTLLASDIEDDIDACAENGKGCVDTRTWHFKLSAGYGERSNPLHGAKNLPIYVIPDVYYYGDRFFLDNGTLGYSLRQRSRFELSAITKFNLERAYFASNLTGFWLGNQVVSGSGDIGFTPPPDDSDPTGSSGSSGLTLNIDDVASRKWAVDAGIQLDSYPYQNLHLRIQVLTDITGVHNGQQANVRVATPLQGRFGLIELGAELHWKSDDLIDYYYGIGPRDQGVPPAYYYQGSSVWQPALTLSWHYPLAEKWSWVSSGRMQWLGSGMSDSPLVERRHVFTFFTGVQYRF
ncbi:MipA/OmpV family protein [Aliidiomarina halalkaliphila]|uniref:MipA/OmpV family protein n=1 Tax=Aliidiomarina halalkaliphila TaxID=2593535 RepID=UPI00163D78E6|nr:MipA/OmpV family protein [Aliidiomarina halalkaliphila]